MLPIRRILLLSAMLLMLCASARAEVQVNNLTLEKNGQFTELTIRCSGTPEFTHQIVEQAANKPYRIVVDVKNAIHALPQHAFAKLPTGSIKQIRTSQYSTDPEKIVRVVVDASGAVTYKVNAGEFGVTLMISTPNDQNFAMWTAVPGGPVVAANPNAAQPATPKTMPAAPGNEANAPKIDKADPAKQDLKLANKPIDEGVLLNKKPSNSSDNNNQAAPAQANPTATAKPVVEAAKPQPTPATAQQPVKEEPKAVAATPPANAEKKPAAPVDPKLWEAIYGKPQPTVAANPQANTGKPQPSETASPNAQTPTPAKTESKPATGEVKSEPAKVVDSAVIPQLQNPAVEPGMSPSEVIKPPKDQKTGLPEVKVNPKPKFAENPSTTPNAAKLGTALTSNKPAVPAEEAVIDESETLPNLAEADGDDNVKSKSEAVRERYQASRDKANASIESAVDSAALADEQPANPSATKIDRIRNKYKRGIKFVQNEADEQRLAELDIEVPVEDAAPSPQVGPYSEFLPEREIVVYNSGGRIDPFEALIEDAKKSAGYDRIPDVDGLRLVGVLLDKRTSRALFEDANGYSYILQTGDRVKNGFVLSITEDRVVFQIRQYGWNRQVALELEDNQ